MRKYWKRWKIRLDAVWSVLTTEFILIHNIKRTTNDAGQAVTEHIACYRTSNPDWHDFLVVKGEAFRKYGKLPAEIKVNPDQLIIK